jgi:Sec7-like guanine-nucleotide exchange factor
VQVDHEAVVDREVSLATVIMPSLTSSNTPSSASERDLRSHEMRSKLLSLQLVLTILQSHSDLFADPNVSIPSTSSNESTPFLQATKQYLCLSLSRNALSPVIQVFELSIEIFWRVLKSLRAQMKVGRQSSCA